MTDNRSKSIRRARGLLCVLLVFVMLLSSFPVLAEETGVVTTKVVLRKSASAESKALQTLPEGEEVEIRGTSGSWYRVQYGQFTGYIMKKYVKVGGSSSSGSSGGSSSGSSSGSSTRSQIAALGTAPGPMRVGDTGDYVIKLQKALTILGYFNGRVDGDYGELTTAAVTSYQMAKKLEADGVAGPATVKAIFGSVGPDLRDATTDTTASTTPTTSSSKYSMTGIDSIADIGAAPDTCREGDSGDGVAKLQQALTLLGYYSGPIDGSFGGGTLSAVKRFQRNRGLTQDGVAGSSTLRILFNTGDAPKTSGSSSSGSSNGSSGSSASYTTEVPDWFNGGESLIPKGARFTIKDVRTGRTFEAVRWSGYNHLDAEPRSSDDTATMKSIYGGAWSWNRRPILILYNGHVYAASMNGMPHGTSTIDNSFDGHFCIDRKSVV